MNRKYFVCSDIHGFYDEWMDSLNRAGFNREESSHVLIVLGDIFDRGKQPLKVYKFLRELPKERRILIRGNHESLLGQLVKRFYAEPQDEHNGTVDTLFLFGGYEGYKEFNQQQSKEKNENKLYWGMPEYENFRTKWNNKRNAVYTSDFVKEVLDWINSNEWCDFYETKKYIFVHSFIPIRKYLNLEKSMWCGFYVYDKDPTYREDWRNATSFEWDDAKWGCPWEYELKGLNRTGKTIVCCHWHTSDFFNNLLFKNQKSKHLDPRVSNPIFKSDKFPGLIGLDACTALTKVVNVLVLNEADL